MTAACSSVATYEYPAQKCVVKVERGAPGSPLPVQVPPKTTVFVEVDGQRQTETLKYTTTTDVVARPDLLGGFVKQFVSPLSTVLLESRIHGFDQPLDPIFKEQEDVADALKEPTTDINRAAVEVSCLQTYSIFDESGACLTGQQGTLAYDDFDRALADTTTDLNEAISTYLPVAELKAIDDEIKTRIAKCPNLPDPSTNPSEDVIKLAIQDRKLCFSEMDYLQQNENRLNDAVAALQASQKNLVQVAPILTSLASPKASPAQSFVNESDRKATIKIVAIDAIGKNSTDVATVVITWQSTRFVVSTGVMLSTLENNTFANSPIYDASGAPVLDAGKVTTQVTVTHTRPSVVFPLVMANWRLHSFSKGCHGNCSFLIGGGMGANLSSKTADLAAIVPIWQRAVHARLSLREADRINQRGEGR
jgi:hypothetical protein